MSLAPTARALAARLGGDEGGATAVEYGLMVALIAVVIVLAVAGLGAQISDSVSSEGEQVETASGGDAGR